MAEAPEQDVAAAIAREGPALSQHVIAEMYRTNPFWEARFGARGRDHADEDGDFHIRYLVEAMRSSSPAVMTTYGRWLRGLLTARGMCTRHLADNFARLADAIASANLPGGKLAVEVLGAAETGLRHDHPVAGALQDRAPYLAAEAIAPVRGRHPSWDGDESGPGWERCLDDALYLLSYLADAVAAGAPGLFADYVRFSAGFLGPRGIAPAHLDELLRELETVVARNPELAPATGVISAGRAALASR
jgi:hypothetical protein